MVTGIRELDKPMQLPALGSSQK